MNPVAVITGIILLLVALPLAGIAVKKQYGKYGVKLLPVVREPMQQVADVIILAVLFTRWV